MTDTTLIKESEVMAKLHIASRTTMWKYCRDHNFPKPVRTHPKAYLRAAVDEWLLNGGINPKVS
ncbi:AlpA family transcriptional regulator [Erwinia sp. Leaf53]|uniref:helix-turn-helix transcriptional regulator n=1 Tax=Erwinia sp. Leaf53 TaxID=1736225 RepID=UPI0006F8B9D3|nr:AlpA family phage regulatory protein [Erwinia sp. Leaf53]KQN63670.1 AlpA family transcriptional regulator [Erwinia sp. Leaf53]